jgi:hypothetical protein
MPFEGSYDRVVCSEPLARGMRACLWDFDGDVLGSPLFLREAWGRQRG